MATTAPTPRIVTVVGRPQRSIVWLPMASPRIAPVTLVAESSAPATARDSGRKDETLPQALRDLLSDDETWVLYKPTGKEIDALRDIFGPLGRGSIGLYREALTLLREFA